MADYYTLLTTIGAARLANAQALGTSVALTHVAVGDGNGAAYDPVESQVALVNEVWRGQINQIYVHADNANWLVIEAVVPEDIGGWFVREVGVFDSDGNLFAIGKYPVTYKPVLASGSAKDLYIRMILEISNAAEVTLKIDPAIVLATRKYVSDRFAEHGADPNAHAAATTERRGFVELATPQETAAGEDDERAVTPFAFALALAAALENGLDDVAFLDAAQSWTKAQHFEAAALVDSETVDWDLSGAQVATLTLGGNRTMAAPAHMADGGCYVLTVKQPDEGGPYTLSWNAAYGWGSAGAPTLSTGAGKSDVFTFISTGSSMRCIGRAGGF